MSEEVQVRGPGRPPKPKTIACVVLRDFWDENGDRQRAGKVVEVSVEAAMDGVEAGIPSRVKNAD